MIDLGLRLEDVKDLESEPVDYKKDKDPLSALQRYGATVEEQRFLVSHREKHRRCFFGRRVELNSMTAEQLITWLERKFKEHGVKKFIPDQEALETGYRYAEYRNQLQDIIDRIEIPDNTGPVPDDLLESITGILEANPELSWDEAIWKLLENK